MLVTQAGYPLNNLQLTLVGFCLQPTQAGQASTSESLSLYLKGQSLVEELTEQTMASLSIELLA